MGLLPHPIGEITQRTFRVFVIEITELTVGEIAVVQLLTVSVMAHFLHSNNFGCGPQRIELKG
jgi:hypothetical protein